MTVLNEAPASEPPEGRRRLWDPGWIVVGGVVGAVWAIAYDAEGLVVSKGRQRETTRPTSTRLEAAGHFRW